MGGRGAPRSEVRAVPHKGCHLGVLPFPPPPPAAALAPGAVPRAFREPAFWAGLPPVAVASPPVAVELGPVALAPPPVAAAPPQPTPTRSSTVSSRAIKMFLPRRRGRRGAAQLG
jgi:hypothetical protein